MRAVTWGPDTSIGEANDGMADSVTAQVNGKPKPNDLGKTKRIVCSLIPLALSILIAITSVASGSRTEKLTARSDDATVSHVDVKTRHDSDGDKATTVTVTILYEDSDHAKHSVQSLYQLRDASRHKEGEKVSVMYDPRNPDGGCVIVGEEKLVDIQSDGNAGIWVAVGFSLSLLIWLFMP